MLIIHHSSSCVHACQWYSIICNLHPPYNRHQRLPYKRRTIPAIFINHIYNSRFFLYYHSLSFPLSLTKSSLNCPNTTTPLSTDGYSSTASSYILSCTRNSSRLTFRKIHLFQTLRTFERRCWIGKIFDTVSFDGVFFESIRICCFQFASNAIFARLLSPTSLCACAPAPILGPTTPCPSAELLLCKYPRVIIAPNTQRVLEHRRSETTFTHRLPFERTSERASPCEPPPKHRPPVCQCRTLLSTLLLSASVFRCAIFCKFSLCLLALPRSQRLIEKFRPSKRFDSKAVESFGKFNSQ